jgi:hypothetical protein
MANYGEFSSVLMEVGDQVRFAGRRVGEVGDALSGEKWHPGRLSEWCKLTDIHAALIQFEHE